MRKNISSIFLAVFTFSTLASAEDESLPKYFLTLGAHYLYSGSTADSMAGATYTEYMNRPVVFDLALGFSPLPNFYLGAAFESWYARRNYSLTSGGGAIDRLMLDNIGIETGFVTANPRIMWLATAAIFYPLMSQVGSTLGQIYRQEPKQISLRFKAGVAFKLESWFAWWMGFGYQKIDLGDITDNGASFLSGNFDLSGPFLGTSLVLTFY